MSSCSKLPDADDYNTAERMMMDKLHTDYATSSGKYKMHYNKYPRPKYIKIPKGIYGRGNVLRVFGTVDCTEIHLDTGETKTGQFYFIVEPTIISETYVLGGIAIYRKKYDYYEGNNYPHEYNINPNQTPYNPYGEVATGGNSWSGFTNEYVNDAEDVSFPHNDCYLCKIIVPYGASVDGENINRYQYYYDFEVVDK